MGKNKFCWLLKSHIQRGERLSEEEKDREEDEGERERNTKEFKKRNHSQGNRIISVKVIKRSALDRNAETGEIFRKTFIQRSLRLESKKMILQVLTNSQGNWRNSKPEISFIHRLMHRKQFIDKASGTIFRVRSEKKWKTWADAGTRELRPENKSLSKRALAKGNRIPSGTTDVRKFFFF